MKRKLYSFGLVLLPIIVFFVCLCLGRMRINPNEVMSALLNIASEQTHIVVFSMRVPRLILACVVGAGLSLSGCVFQSVFANPLATPDTLGVASGASFGAVLGLLFGFNMIVVQILALAFGILAVVLMGFTCSGLKNWGSVQILSGIMIGSLFNSLISLVKFVADTESTLPAITYWLMGSMESAGYNSLIIGVPPIVVSMIIIFLLRWRINLLVLSDDEAISAGVNIRRLRIITELCATIITASSVSMCGQVGWVGLLVPHLCRMKFGSNHTLLIPTSICVGASFMMITDTLARTISPKEIPISILTAIIGAPFFIYLLRKNRRWSL